LLGNDIVIPSKKHRQLMDRKKYKENNEMLVALNLHFVSSRNFRLFSLPSNFYLCARQN